MTNPIGPSHLKKPPSSADMALAILPSPASSYYRWDGAKQKNRDQQKPIIPSPYPTTPTVHPPPVYRPTRTQAEAALEGEIQAVAGLIPPASMLRRFFAGIPKKERLPLNASATARLIQSSRQKIAQQDWYDSVNDLSPASLANLMEVAVRAGKMDLASKEACALVREALVKVIGEFNDPNILSARLRTACHKAHPDRFCVPDDQFSVPNSNTKQIANDLFSALDNLHQAVLSYPDFFYRVSMSHDSLEIKSQGFILNSWKKLTVLGVAGVGVAGMVGPYINGLLKTYQQD